MDYPTAVQNLANAVRTAVQLASFNRDAAIDLVCRDEITNAQKAKSRTGHWVYEATTEQIEDALFQGKVAADALAGDISVPSVGNVREAIRAASFTDAELFGAPGEIDTNDHMAH